MSNRSTWTIVLSACGALIAVGAAASSLPTRLEGILRDPVDDAGIAGGQVVVGPRHAATRGDGSFEVRVGRNRQGNLATRFAAPDHAPYESWTPSGGELSRQVYLFPTTGMRFAEQDEEITPQRFRDHFDIVYRDPIWTDPEQRVGRLRRWTQQPEISIDTRVLEERHDPEWAWVAREKVPGAVRRQVRDTIAALIGPLTGGFLQPGRIRFERMQPGEVIARDVDDVYRPGGLRISFIDSGLYDSGGGVRVEGDTIVSGNVTLDVGTVLTDIRRGNDSLTAHEFAHALGMFHRMEGTHGVSGTLLCSIMGGPCAAAYRRPLHQVPSVDWAIARLAYSRMPGNDRADRDPEPDSAANRVAGASSRFVVFHVPARLLPQVPGLIIAR